MARFFVRVFAPDAASLGKLAGTGLDLFRATAVAAKARIRPKGKRGQAADAVEAVDDSAESLASTPYIDGLLSLEEIGRLVSDGYRVLVNADADRRARALTETVEFEAWLKGMEER